MIKLLSKIWTYTVRGGVYSSEKSERPLILLYNQMALISIVFTILIGLTTVLIGYPIAYILLVFVLIFYYASILICNHFNHIYASRFIVSVFFPIWVCTTHLLIAGHFNQDLLIVTSLIITYVSFYHRSKNRNRLILFTIFIYLVTLAYGRFNEPYFGEIDFPYDDLIIFFVAIGWIGNIIHAFFSERKKLIQDLRFNNTQLRQTTKELEQFTYIASHDLKSPLRTISSFVGLIERDIKREKYEGLVDKLQFVKTGTKQMNTLVEDILEISVLNNPDKKKKKKINLNVIANKVQDNLREEIKAKNAFLKIENLPSYYCDEAEFTLLFQNMIQNGIKYNDSTKPQITISSQLTEDQMIISFKDNGIGIDEAYHEQIFQFFKRLHSSEKYQGTGLGLGLCKKIINSYGGEIEVDSELGEGSVFRIKLEMEARGN